MRPKILSIARNAADKGPLYVFDEEGCLWQWSHDLSDWLRVMSIDEDNIQFLPTLREI